MIKLLRVNNIALIRQLDVELGSGLTLLTGETGAGKSIVLDALSLLLGERASADLIRSGEERASVEAVVELPGAEEALDRRGLPADGDDIVLRREIHVSGKGRATVNGAIVPVAVLRDLAPRIATIYGQHEPQGLVDPLTHLDLLDAYAGLDDRGALAEAFRELRGVESALQALRRDRREAERRREMLLFQAGEIESAGLQRGEEDALRLEKARQANAGRLAALSSEAYALLYDDEGAALGRLGQVYKRVEELAAIDPAFRAHSEGRSSLVAALEELALLLRDYRERLEISPGRLDEIESRLSLLDRLKKKYGSTLEEVIGFGERCRTELQDAGTPEEQERALEEKRVRLAETYLAEAQRLSECRRRKAGELEARVQAELAQLAMAQARFRVRFEPESPRTDDPSLWTERGLETGEFFLSPNPGEELRPLARIASGGELSRLMLALKTVARFDTPGLTLVFDEVDAGIGGRVAEVVGRKLRALSAGHQVLCVTHLPQIAAFADHHFAVGKREHGGRTVTEVRGLSPQERVDELARMLGGATVTETARKHAREMLNQSVRS